MAPRLETFLRAHGLKPAQVAREAGVSRQHLLRIRRGTMGPTRARMVQIADGCSRLLRRRVQVGEVFDLGEIIVTVTAKQGRLFAEGWFRGSIDDACDETGIMKWPDADIRVDEASPAQDRFHDITDEICERVFEAVKASIAEAFVTAATDVLSREQRRADVQK